MFVEYDEYELMELFESEPISIADKEAGMFIYSLSDTLGFKLVMSLSIYENECKVSLSYTDKTIFDIQLKDVVSIKSNGKQLRINRRNSDRDVIIGFKPNFSLIIENI
jgi:hypothetical protein